MIPGFHPGAAERRRPPRPAGIRANEISFVDVERPQFIDLTELAKNPDNIALYEKPPAFIEERYLDRGNIQKYIGDPELVSADDLEVNDDYSFVAVPEVMTIAGEVYQVKSPGKIGFIGGKSEHDLTKGAQGEIFRARPLHVQPGSVASNVVVKFLPVQCGKNTERHAQRQELVENEIAAWQQTGSLIDVRELISENGDIVYMLAIEYLDGTDMEKLQREREQLPPEQRFSPQETLNMLYATQAFLEDLERARKNGLTHRDIKPPNLMYNRRNPQRSRVIDWGLAYHGDNLQEGNADIGTMEYMPIASFEKKGIPEYVDIYELILSVAEVYGVVKLKKGEGMTNVMLKKMNGNFVAEEHAYDEYLGSVGKQFAQWMFDIIQPAAQYGEYRSPGNIQQDGYAPFIEQLNTFIEQQEKIVSHIPAERLSA